MTENRYDQLSDTEDPYDQLSNIVVTMTKEYRGSDTIEDRGRYLAHVLIGFLLGKNEAAAHRISLWLLYGKEIE